MLLPIQHQKTRSLLKQCAGSFNWKQRLQFLFHCTNFMTINYLRSSGEYFRCLFLFIFLGIFFGRFFFFFNNKEMSG